MSAEQTPIRRTARARKINSRFIGDDIDEGYRKLVGRITASSHGKDPSKSPISVNLQSAKQSPKSAVPTVAKVEPKCSLESEKSIFPEKLQKKCGKKNVKLPEVAVKEIPDHVGSKIIRWRSSTESDSEESRDCSPTVHAKSDLDGVIKALTPHKTSSLQEALGDAMNSFSGNKHQPNLSVKLDSTMLKGISAKISLKPVVVKSKSITLPESIKAANLQSSENTAHVSSDGEDDIPLKKLIKKTDKISKKSTKCYRLPLKKLTKVKDAVKKRNSSKVENKGSSKVIKNKLATTPMLKKCNVLIKQTNIPSIKKSIPVTSQKVLKSKKAKGHSDKDLHKKVVNSNSQFKAKNKLSNTSHPPGKKKKFLNNSLPSKKLAKKGLKKVTPATHLVSLSSLVLEFPVQCDSRATDSIKVKNDIKKGAAKTHVQQSSDNLSLVKSKLNNSSTKTPPLKKLKGSVNDIKAVNKRKSDQSFEGPSSKRMKPDSNKSTDTKQKDNAEIKPKDNNKTANSPVISAKSELYVVESNSISYVVEASLTNSTIKQKFDKPIPSLLAKQKSPTVIPLPDTTKNESISIKGGKVYDIKKKPHGSPHQMITSVDKKSGSSSEHKHIEHEIKIQSKKNDTSHSLSEISEKSPSSKISSHIPKKKSDMSVTVTTKGNATDTKTDLNMKSGLANLPLSVVTSPKFVINTPNVSSVFSPGKAGSPLKSLTIEGIRQSQTFDSLSSMENIPKGDSGMQIEPKSKYSDIPILLGNSEPNEYKSSNEFEVTSKISKPNSTNGNSGIELCKNSDVITDQIKEDSKVSDSLFEYEKCTKYSNCDESDMKYQPSFDKDDSIHTTTLSHCETAKDTTKDQGHFENVLQSEHVSPSQKSVDISHNEHQGVTENNADVNKSEHQHLEKCVDINHKSMQQTPEKCTDASDKSEHQMINKSSDLSESSKNQDQTEKHVDLLDKSEHQMPAEKPVDQLLCPDKSAYGKDGIKNLSTTENNTEVKNESTAIILESNSIISQKSRDSSYHKSRDDTRENSHHRSRDSSYRRSRDRSRDRHRHRSSQRSRWSESDRRDSDHRHSRSHHRQSDSRSRHDYKSRDRSPDRWDRRHSRHSRDDSKSSRSTYRRSPDRSISAKRIEIPSKVNNEGTNSSQNKSPNKVDISVGNQPKETNSIVEKSDPNNISLDHESANIPIMPSGENFIADQESHPCIEAANNSNEKTLNSNEEESTLTVRSASFPYPTNASDTLADAKTKNINETIEERNSTSKIWNNPPHQVDDVAQNEIFVADRKVKEVGAIEIKTELTIKPVSSKVDNHFAFKEEDKYDISLWPKSLEETNILVHNIPMPPSDKMTVGAVKSEPKLDKENVLLKSDESSLNMPSPILCSADEPNVPLSPKCETLCTEYINDSLLDIVPMDVDDDDDIEESKIKESSPAKEVISAEERERLNREVVRERLKSFVHLSENFYVNEKTITRSKEVRRMVCDCFLSKEELEAGDKGCGDDCLNRLLMIECGSRCPLKDQCMNKLFQNRTYSKVEVFNAAEKGCGIRATEEISSGSFIMEYVGEVFGSKEFKKRRREYAKESTAHFYFMALRADTLIDATRKGNISRFINHSCDPNAETQKWTVNGVLRIGFFAKKPIALGEEINFDYRLERYGREPQKCYCGTAICRGWLGESPDEKTKEEIEHDKKKILKDKKRREEKRPLFDNIDVQDEIEKLSLRGLRNRQDTLDLSRLMVRAEESASRLALLQLLREAEKACKRLFLDCHGLKLLWSWMVDLTVAREFYTLKLQILQILENLPVTNRTQLTDSKVLPIVEKWSTQDHNQPDAFVSSPDETRPSDQESNSGLAKSSLEGEKSTSEPGTQSSTPDDSSLDSVTSVSKKETAKSGFNFLSNLLKEASRGLKSRDTGPSDIKPVCDEALPLDSIPATTKVAVGKSITLDSEIPLEPTLEVKSPTDESSSVTSKDGVSTLAKKLLDDWGGLSEAFRIPKKERIEIMKEHEREVEKGFKEFLDNAGSDTWSSYYGNYNRRDSEDRKRNRRRSRNRERDREREMRRIEINEDSGLSKEERRERFAVQAAKDEEEARYRKSLQESVWNLHLRRCAQLSRNPSFTPIFDGSGQFYWNPLAGNWQPFVGQCETLPVPALYGAICGEDQSSPSLFPESLHVSGLSPECVDTFVQTRSEYSSPTEVKPRTSLPLIPPRPVTITLPTHWKLAVSEGRAYFYHKRTRTSQWCLPTAETHLQLLKKFGIEADSEFDSDSSSGTSDSDAFSSEEEVEVEDANSDAVAVVCSSDGSEEKMIRRHRGKRKRSEKLVQERAISPIMMVDREAMRTERRLAGERAQEEARKERWQSYADGVAASSTTQPEDSVPSPNEDDDPTPIQRPSKKHKSVEAVSRRHKSKARAASALADTSENACGIKNSFRSLMATFIVGVLNPYRKSDCKVGRIVSNDDFKYLAKKLTHFVMVKELKQLPSIDGLMCNDSVKNKTREFVRKYMSKYGSRFKRDPNDTKEYVWSAMV